MSTSPIIYTADAIVRYGKKIVIIERLGSVRGLALPGGKQDLGETLSTTIKREVREETGLDFVIEDVLRTCAEEGRDPRGRYVSTIFLGTAHGILRNEPAKTNVLLCDESEFHALKHRFIFDHAGIITDYFEKR